MCAIRARRRTEKRLGERLSVRMRDGGEGFVESPRDLLCRIFFEQYAPRVLAHTRGLVGCIAKPDEEFRQLGRLSRVNANTAVGFEKDARHLAVRPEDRDPLLRLAGDLGVPAVVVGRSGGSRVRIDVAGRRAIDCDLAAAEHVWTSAIERHFAGRAA